MSMAQYGDLLILSTLERDELTRRAQSRSLPAGDVFRARLILALADGFSYREIEKRLHTSSPTIARWAQRFQHDRMDGLNPCHKGSRPRVVTAAVQARILRRTLQAPPDGSTHWTCRKLALTLGVSKSSVQRVWSRARLKPHRLDRYMASNDPEFERKAADIIGLYLNPPQHAAVFCVDEKTAIQALDRLDPVLPLSPGRAERHGFEYYRHGTLSLYAALNTKTGEVLGKTTQRHTTEQFVAFLSQVVASQRRGREIHIIADNLSAHKTKRVEQFLSEHLNVRLHFTPTYSSWLNQVEIWFSRIERHVITRGVFTSKADLARKLMRYIRAYNRNATPIKWSYSDPSTRINVAHTSTVTGH